MCADHKAQVSPSSHFPPPLPMTASGTRRARVCIHAYCNLEHARFEGHVFSAPSPYLNMLSSNIFAAVALRRVHLSDVDLHARCLAIYGN